MKLWKMMNVFQLRVFCTGKLSLMQSLITHSAAVFHDNICAYDHSHNKVLLYN